MELSYSNLSTQDLHEIYNACREDFRELDGKKILCLGGTGFVGKWLVASLLYARKFSQINFELEIVTRNPLGAMQALNLSDNHELNITTWDFAKGKYLFTEHYDLMFLGATASVPKTGSLNLQKSQLAALNSTFSIVDWIERTAKQSRIINLSSGAVYGQLESSPNENKEFSITRSSYAETKIKQEEILNLASENTQTEVIHARLFAFAGPHISLKDHFAVGNFMNDALNESDIKILGNPHTVRSYLYPGDLIKSLLKLTTSQGISKINVGSNHEITMQELAKRVKVNVGGASIILENDQVEPSYYVPDNSVLQSIIEVEEFLNIDEILKRWAAWEKLISRS